MRYLFTRRSPPKGDYTLQLRHHPLGREAIAKLLLQPFSMDRFH